MLYMPIVVPFYESNGLSMKDIMVLQAVYSVAIVILEVPSGYLADVIGRRKTLIIGAIFGTLGFTTYSLSYGFYGFLIAEIILGVGQSCISGADSAMLYDSLLDRGEEKKYTRFEGRITSLGNLAEAIAGILGGLLAGIAIRAPYVAQSFVAFIALPAAITLVEPVRKTLLVKGGMLEILQIARFALITDRPLRRNIIFSEIVNLWGTGIQGLFHGQNWGQNLVIHSDKLKGLLCYFRRGSAYSRHSISDKTNLIFS